MRCVVSSGRGNILYERKNGAMASSFKFGRNAEDNRGKRIVEERDGQRHQASQYKMMIEENVEKRYGRRGQTEI